jgi:hypothetical protein
VLLRRSNCTGNHIELYAAAPVARGAVQFTGVGPQLSAARLGRHRAARRAAAQKGWSDGNLSLKPPSSHHNHGLAQLVYMLHHRGVVVCNPSVHLVAQGELAAAQDAVRQGGADLDAATLRKIRLTRTFSQVGQIAFALDPPRVSAKMAR